MVVTAPVHDSEEPVLVQPFEADHRGVEPEPIGRLDDLAFGDPELRSGAVVGGIAVRHDGIQAIVAARQFDDDENSLGMLFDTGALERLCGEYGRRAAKDQREPDAHTDAVHATREEVAARTRARKMSVDHLNSPSPQPRPPSPFSPYLILRRAQHEIEQLTERLLELLARLDC